MKKDLIQEINTIQDTILTRMLMEVTNDSTGIRNSSWYKNMSETILNLEKAKHYESGSICNWGTIISSTPEGKVINCGPRGEVKIVKEGETLWTSSGTSATSSPPESS